MYEFFFFRSYLLMVMEYMEGGELFERIRKKVSFTEKEACEITKQVSMPFHCCLYISSASDI